MTTERTLDLNDAKRALAVVQPSGDEFIVEYVSVWQDGDCIGTQIVAAVGPISRRADLGDDGSGSTVNAIRVFDAIDNAVNLSSEDADWLQAEEDAGRLTYPLGAR